MAKDSINLSDYEDIEVYNMLRFGVIGRFPNNFWGGLDTFKTAKDLTRYMFEDILKWDLEDIKNNVTTDIFYDNRLGGMLKQLFNNNVLDALLNAYPELEEWVESKRKIKRGKEEDKEEKEEHESREKYTDEELIENIRNKFTQLNRNPYIREMSDPDGNVYLTRFGSWTKALIASGLLEDICVDVDDSEEAILEAQRKIKEFAYQVERYPTEEEVENLFSPGEIKVYFKSLAGLYDYLTEGYTEEELINILLDKKNKLGKNPTNKDMKFPRAIIFIDKFESWENALKEAGLGE